MVMASYVQAHFVLLQGYYISRLSHLEVYWFTSSFMYQAEPSCIQKGRRMAAGSWFIRNYSHCDILQHCSCPGFPREN
jgi:hypothetical protein